MGRGASCVKIFTDQPADNQKGIIKNISLLKKLIGYLYNLWGKLRILQPYLYLYLSDKPIPMKLIRVAAILMAAALVTNACKKDEEQPSSSFTFTFDGQQYVAHEPSAYVTDTIISGQKALVVDGVTNNFKRHMQLIVMSPDDSLNIGTYSGSTVTLMPVQDTVTEGYIGTSIEVQITSINSKRAEGTFKGTLNKSGEVDKPLTDGTFKVNIN